MSEPAEEECDLLWQHEHQKRWIIYSPEELIVINKAYRKCQKSTTLPSSNPKKKLKINFQKMYQKNAVSEYEQRIRCIVLNKEAYVWLWQEDENWNSYSPGLSLLLEIAYQKKQKLVQFCLKNNYEINLENFTQVNCETSFSRSVKREKVEVIGNSPEIVSVIMKLSFACERHIAEMVKRQDLKFKKNLDSTFYVQNGLQNKQAHVAVYNPEETTMELDVPKTQSFLNMQSAESGEVDLPGTTFLPADPSFTENQQYHVYCSNSKSYNATLNLTAIQRNNNKFYILQLLEHKNKKLYGVWYRWGRVGSEGQNKFIKFGPNLSLAQEEFESKFYNKTGNSWNDNFQKIDGKYDYILTDYSFQVPSSEKHASKLDPKLQSLIELICDQMHMEELLNDFCYDSKRIPLGKLDMEQIDDGYIALKKVSSCITKKKSRKELIEACNEFYTKIPHNFGRSTPPVIDTLEEFHKKLDLLEVLYNIHVAMIAMNSVNVHDREHPFDLFYKFMECSLEPLLPTSEEFIAIQNCLKNTHGPTHSTYKMEVIDIFRCAKDDRTFLNYKNNLLLWHGSRIINWYGILKKGLEIAPPEAPTTGYMFGKGIYFADVASKSANYCYATKKKNEGLLLLSEVSVGNQLCLHHSEEMPSHLPNTFQSVFGKGRVKPSSFKTTVLSAEAKLPFGPLAEVDEDVSGYSLQYNEYVVYNSRQVKMKYLVKIRFDFCN